MSGMQIHSMRHAQLEINYLEQKGALDDELGRAWGRTFKDSAEIGSWKTDFKKKVDPVFTPLTNYFEGRAIRQRITAALGLIPMGLGAVSLLGAAGVTGGGLLLAGLGIFIVLKSTSGVEHCNEQVVALANEKMNLLRSADQVAEQCEYKLTHPQPGTTTTPQPAATPTASPAPQPAATAPPAAPPTVAT